MEPVDLGGGVLLFRRAIEIDQDFLIPYLADLHKKAVSEDFTVIKDDDGKELYAINRSGHRYDVADIYRVNRIMGFATDDENSKQHRFFSSCEDAIYSCLLRYIERFPMILPSLWWRTQGHVVAYRPGSDMGLHSDNDVNYQPNAIPDMQVATRHVLGTIMYLNDSVDIKDQIGKYEYTGGELAFQYLNIKYKPKSGDIIMFPSNYMGTHMVEPCNGNSRYAYIAYFSHGSPDEKRGIGPMNRSTKIQSAQVWMPEVFDDYAKYIEKKYGDDLVNHPLLTLPLSRINNSTGTIEEALAERNKE
jgi:hypothetical protein